MKARTVHEERWHSLRMKLRIVSDDGPGSAARHPDILCEQDFQRTLWLERRRAERSQRPALLMLVSSAQPGALNTEDWNLLIGAVTGVLRETDISGWHKDGIVLGVVLTELGGADEAAAQRAVSLKIESALGRALTGQEKHVRLTFCPVLRLSGSPGEGQKAPIYADGYASVS